ncbi:MFS transporter [Haloarcula sp. 1CSR25-25]|uniref:MFS transporter n=1 Tax=Haloarcula sp. 1CSR25-25 TaxID=2862545 RepID=UPI00289540D6|nr:MFS transporter [Haloarcula sp. 1CSR25-25]MDT3436995.1 MFS transporter [Haloarcula sp. 1CSR25-25]
MGSSARQLGLLTGWQTVASTCFYALFAGTALLSDAIGLSRFQVGLVVTAGTLGYTVALFPVGAAVDGAGEKPVLVGGLLALALGVAAVGLAGSYYPLLAAACVLGAAYATAMPATNRAIVTTIPAAIRGRAMGIKQVGVTGGSGVAAVLVVSFAPSVGAWNLGFLLVGGLAVVVALLFALGYSGTPGGEWRLPDVRALGQNTAYVSLAGAGFFLGAALFTTVGYATLYLTDAVEVSVAVAGAGFAAMQVSGSGGRVVAGWVADRRTEPEARANALVLLGQATLGVLLLAALATPGLPKPIAMAALVGVGATVLGFTGLYYACMTALVPTDEVGAATAGGQTALNGGALLAPPAFGFLADTISFRASWALLAGVATVGVALLAVTVRRTGDPTAG